MSNMDAIDLAEVSAFLDDYHATADAIRAELQWSGEQATIRRVLDLGSTLERAALFSVLAGCNDIVVKLGELETADEEVQRACEETGTRFLRGIIGEGEQIDTATLRAELKAWAKGAAQREGLFLIKANDTSAGAQPFTSETLSD